MNQILATSNNGNNKNEKYNQEYNDDRAREIDFSNEFSAGFSKPSTNVMDPKKIIIFFCIAICIFGVVLAGFYGYKYLKGKKQKEINKPQVLVEQDGNSAIISAKSEIGIDKIIYYWDETDKNELQIDGKTSYEKIIELPKGENKLTIQIIDKNGQTIEDSKSFIADIDDKKPKIEVEVIEEEGVKKAKIIATDETAMQYIKYRWNMEEDVKIEVEDEQDTTIETKVNIERGENTLIITAVDASENTEEVEKPFKAGNAPVIDIGVDGNKLIMKITHDIGFEKVEFSLNGKIYTYDENFSGYDSTQKILEYTFTLIEGKNTVAIIATSMENTTQTYKGQTTYTPE